MPHDISKDVNDTHVHGEYFSPLTISFVTDAKEGSSIALRISCRSKKGHARKLSRCSSMPVISRSLSNTSNPEIQSSSNSAMIQGQGSGMKSNLEKTSQSSYNLRELRGNNRNDPSESSPMLLAKASFSPNSKTHKIDSSNIDTISNINQKKSLKPKLGTVAEDVRVPPYDCDGIYQIDGDVSPTDTDNIILSLKSPNILPITKISPKNRVETLQAESSPLFCPIISNDDKKLIDVIDPPVVEGVTTEVGLGDNLVQTHGSADNNDEDDDDDSTYSEIDTVSVSGSIDLALRTPEQSPETLSVVGVSGSDRSIRDSVRGISFDINAIEIGKIENMIGITNGEKTDRGENTPPDEMSHNLVQNINNNDDHHRDLLSSEAPSTPTVVFHRDFLPMSEEEEEDDMIITPHSSSSSSISLGITHIESNHSTTSISNSNSNSNSRWNPRGKPMHSTDGSVSPFNGSFTLHSHPRAVPTVSSITPNPSTSEVKAHPKVTKRRTIKKASSPYNSSYALTTKLGTIVREDPPLQSNEVPNVSAEENFSKKVACSNDVEHNIKGICETASADVVSGTKDSSNLKSVEETIEKNDVIPTVEIEIVSNKVNEVVHVDSVEEEIIVLSRASVEPSTSISAAQGEIHKNAPYKTESIIHHHMDNISPPSSFLLNPTAKIPTIVSNKSNSTTASNQNNTSSNPAGLKKVSSRNGFPGISIKKSLLKEKKVVKSATTVYNNMKHKKVSDSDSNTTDDDDSARAGSLVTNNNKDNNNDDNNDDGGSSGNNNNNTNTHRSSNSNGSSNDNNACSDNKEQHQTQDPGNTGGHTSLSSDVGGQLASSNFPSQSFISPTSNIMKPNIQMKRNISGLSETAVLTKIIKSCSLDLSKYFEAASSAAAADSPYVRALRGSHKPLSSLLVSSSGNSAFTRHDVLSVIFQVSAGLNCLLIGGYVHSCLSPQNIIGNGSTWRISGLENCIEIGDGLRDVKWNCYSPPELMYRLRKNQKIVTTPGYDVWSLGMICIEMVIGENCLFLMTKALKQCYNCTHLYSIPENSFPNTPIPTMSPTSSTTTITIHEILLQEIMDGFDGDWVTFITEEISADINVSKGGLKSPNNRHYKNNNMNKYKSYFEDENVTVEEYLFNEISNVIKRRKHNEFTINQVLSMIKLNPLERLPLDRLTSDDVTKEFKKNFMYRGMRTGWKSITCTSTPAGARNSPLLHRKGIKSDSSSITLSKGLDVNTVGSELNTVSSPKKLSPLKFSLKPPTISSLLGRSSSHSSMSPNRPNNMNRESRSPIKSPLINRNLDVSSEFVSSPTGTIVRSAPAAIPNTSTPPLKTAKSPSAKASANSSIDSGSSSASSSTSIFQSFTSSASMGFRYALNSMRSLGSGGRTSPNSSNTSIVGALGGSNANISPAASTSPVKVRPPVLREELSVEAKPTHGFSDVSSQDSTVIGSEDIAELLLDTSPLAKTNLRIETNYNRDDNMSLDIPHPANHRRNNNNNNNNKITTATTATTTSNNTNNNNISQLISDDKNMVHDSTKRHSAGIKHSIKASEEKKKLISLSNFQSSSSAANNKIGMKTFGTTYNIMNNKNNNK